MMSGVRLRPASRDDIATLQRWDLDPTVLAAHSDTAVVPDSDWGEEFDTIDRHGPDVWQLLIAVLGDDAGHDRPGARRDIGVVRILDPARDPFGYWHPAGDHLLALDIWIGEPDVRGRGHGSAMMAGALERCFADPTVEAVMVDPLASNERAHRFYGRQGFVAVGRRRFGDDDCLVMRIDRNSWHTVPR